MSSEEITLKFDENTQDAIIGHMFSNNFSFFMRCAAMLKQSYFFSARTASIFDQMVKYFEKHKKAPSPQEIKSQFHNLYPVSAAERAPFISKIDQCVAIANNIRIEWLTAEMTGWIRMVRLKGLIIEATEKYNKGRDYNKMAEWVTEQARGIQQSSFIDSGSIQFGDVLTFFATRNEDLKDCLTIGNHLFDEILRTGALIKEHPAGSQPPAEIYAEARYYTHGGLVKGDTTMILGPSNAGKTTTTISIIVPNVFNQKHVLYITHEQKWEDIKSRMFQSVVNRVENDIRNGVISADKKVTEILVQTSMFLDRYLKYFPYVKSNSMYVEDVIGLICREQEELISTIGKGYDMLVVDYPGKLGSRVISNKAKEWTEIEYVYDQFVNLALEHRFHAILPIQTTREGYKAGLKGDKMIDQGDAAGSFGVMRMASNVITINRTLTDATNQYMKFHVSKSRLSEAGHTFVTTTDFSRCKTHSFRLVGNSFKPGETINDVGIMTKLSRVTDKEVKEVSNIILLNKEENKEVKENGKDDSAG